MAQPLKYDDDLGDPKYLYLDFEYHDRDSRQNPVSCSIADGYSKPQMFWLHDDPARQKIFIEAITPYIKTHTFVCYSVIAEALCLKVLGIDPLKISWIDLLVETRQLQNGFNQYQYGNYIDKDGQSKKSYPPKGGRKNANISNMQIPDNLINSLYVHTGVLLDFDTKHTVRDLIMTGGPFGWDEKEEILQYNVSDIAYLPLLHEEIEEKISKLLPKRFTYHTVATERAAFCAACAVMEDRGIPLNLHVLDSISKNQPHIAEVFIQELNDVYPFYVRTKTTKKDKEEGLGAYKYIKKYEAFENFLKQKKLTNEWPKSTISDSFKADEETLEKYADKIPEIDALRTCNKRISQVRWYRPGAVQNFRDHVGSDGRLRCWHNPFGTRTTRNAPPAKQFIFAQSSWLRCMIEAPPGYAITQLDYSAQEIAIAAALSKDTEMIASYESGDPYTDFGRKAGIIPPDGDKKTHPLEREACKSTCLAINYGMGITSLGIKLSRDTGKFHDDSDARFYMNMHKSVYEIFWNWRDKIQMNYEQGNCLHLRDGWLFGPDNPNILSVLNGPVQGGGGAILRKAVVTGLRGGLDIITTLHDATYIQHKIGDNKPIQRMHDIMVDTAWEYLHNLITVRVDVSTHPHGDVWISGKGKAIYSKLAPYIKFRATLDPAFEDLF